MTIIYTQGDILEDTSQAIVIPVNTVGVPGAGLAKAWAKRDPQAAKLYKALCKLERIKIGEVATITTADSHWILFPTKEHWRDPSKIEWIEDGLIHLSQIIKDIQLTDPLPSLPWDVDWAAWIGRM